MSTSASVLVDAVLPIDNHTISNTYDLHGYQQPVSWLTGYAIFGRCVLDTNDNGELRSLRPLVAHKQAHAPDYIPEGYPQPRHGGLLGEQFLRPLRRGTAGPAPQLQAARRYLSEHALRIRAVPPEFARQRGDPPTMKLPPRYITKPSPPGYSRATSTACASPSGASCRI